MVYFQEFLSRPYNKKEPDKQALLNLNQQEPKAGLEPATYSLRMSYSTN